MGDLPQQPLVEVQHRVELAGGEEVVEVDLLAGERAAQPVDAPVALDEPHRIPGHVVVDDVARLLEVLTLREDVGGDEQVLLVLGCDGRGAGLLGGRLRAELVHARSRSAGLSSPAPVTTT